MNWMVAGAVAMALAGCGGADEISSAGSSGNVTINNPPPVAPPAPPPGPTPPALVTPAGGCPTIDDPAGLRDDGTITGPTGTYRVCALPARFTRSATLTRIPGLLYALDGRVDVGTDLTATPAANETRVVLTIQPGVVFFAKTGVSWLAVNRGHRLQAVGTATRPIVFTSRDNVLGLVNDDSQGQWGGVVLHGRAPITDCIAPGATPGTTSCERQTEGAVDPALYGGATPTDNSGTLRYIQIRYSGYVLSGNSELQGLTLGGVGSGTTVEYIQSHNSSDDAFENFGGTVNMRRLVLTGADDDSVDLDTGYRGTIQYVIAVQKTSGAADSMIELDSTNAAEEQTPRTHMYLANFTFVHRNPASGNAAAILFRGRADVTMVNGVMTTSMPCLRYVGSELLVPNPAIGKIGPPVIRSVVMQCAATPFVGSNGVTVQQVSDNFNAAGANNSATFTPTLTNTFVNGANETAAVAINPQTLDPRFDVTNYVGAVRDAADTWYAGWTCNSSTANFGATSSACTTLPSLAN